MIRLAFILSLLAAPVLAQVTPQPRPVGLVERTGERAAAAATQRNAPAEDVLAMAVDAGAPVVVSDADRAAIAQAFRSIRNCWNTGSLSVEAIAVRITVAFAMTPDGQVIRDSIEMTEFTNGTQAAADEALTAASRAIIRCIGTGFDLPPETHHIWERVELSFDASSVVMR